MYDEVANYFKGFFNDPTVILFLYIEPCVTFPIVNEDDHCFHFLRSICIYFSDLWNATDV